MQDKVLAPATSSSTTVSVTCNLKLEPHDVVTRRIILEGSAASGVTVDCNNATINGGEGTINEGKDMIEIRSRKYSVTPLPGSPDQTTNRWERPQDVTVKHCNIVGSMRIYGMAKNGEGDDLQESSLCTHHIRRARNNAPRRIFLDDLKITGTGVRTPFYIAPGVTYVTLENSEITGESESVGVYLDTESGFNTLRNNYFHTTSRKDYAWGIYTRKREEMAIDNSTGNKIISNRFSSLEGGGIYLYRNCGEGGTIRHGTPSENQIIDNVFYYKDYSGANPAVYLGSRGEGRGYCGDDEFSKSDAQAICSRLGASVFQGGSRADNRSYARENVVMGNQIYKRTGADKVRTRDDGSNEPNYIAHNDTVTTEKVRLAGCYVSSVYGTGFLRHGETTSVFKDTSGRPVCSPYAVTCNNNEVSYTSSSACPLRTVSFDCQVTGNNNGCEKTAYCPTGTRAIGAVAACNLEYGSVSDSELQSVKGNVMKVVRASDSLSDGICSFGTWNIHGGEKELSEDWGRESVRLGCEEHDSNGGDCHIRGTLYCR
ncbi:MAG: right-handed parallel beta-helix repeat-containing protein [Deltaproteobacteria bacterium]|nr:right-handed parallel beta-helix repeat-containing protein [Deltaproteobacteria bacterium]